MKSTSEPALRAPVKAMRPPNHSTRQVPTAMIISTMGESLTFRPRTRSAISMRFPALFRHAPLFVFFAPKGLHHAHGRQHLLDHRDHLAFLFPHFARSLFDAAGVMEDDQRTARGATESAISVNCQFRQNMTAIMPTSVRLLISAPSSPEAMKLWMASMSLVRRLMRSPVCFRSWKPSERRWM